MWDNSKERNLSGKQDLEPEFYRIWVHALSEKQVAEEF
jgi:hypothetical protein